MIEEDKELQEIQQMELAYEKACEFHKQYEYYIIQRRLKFQHNCPHTKTELHEYTDIINETIKITEHCKRCKHLIKIIEK